MRASRIRLGFHRLGLVLCALPIVVWVIHFGNRVYDWRMDREDFEMMLLALGAAVSAYAVCRVLGWVIAGFMANEQ